MYKCVCIFLQQNFGFSGGLKDNGFLSTQTEYGTGLMDSFCQQKAVNEILCKYLTKQGRLMNRKNGKKIALKFYKFFLW